MCACDEGRECARHRAESERHEDEEQREQLEAFTEGRSIYEPLTEGPIGIAGFLSGRYV